MKSLARNIPKFKAFSNFNSLRDSGTYVYHDCDYNATKALCEGIIILIF